MVFSSLIFLYAFFPLSLLVYVLCKGREAKNMSLLVFSLIFYAWGEPKYVLLLMFMSLCSWFCALRVERAASRKGKRAWVAVSCAIDIACCRLTKRLILSKTNNLFHVYLRHFQIISNNVLSFPRIYAPRIFEFCK